MPSGGPSAAAPCAMFAAQHADVAELVDAHGSGPCGGDSVEVRVLSSALSSALSSRWRSHAVAVRRTSKSAKLGWLSISRWRAGAHGQFIGTPSAPIYQLRQPVTQIVEGIALRISSL